MQHGGTINGVIDGLNRILDLSVAEFRTEGGTLVIPGHGRLSDSADVAYYRDMVTIIRDRVQEMIDKGMTLEQVKAAKPTADYEPRYGATTGPWTTDMFIEAVYATLGGGKKPAPRSAHRPHGSEDRRSYVVPDSARLDRSLVLGVASCARLLARRAGRRRRAADARAPRRPIDLTGTWVSVVTEDWRWRMRTPPKGDYASLPLTDAATKVADAWDPGEGHRRRRAVPRLRRGRDHARARPRFASAGRTTPR